MKITKQRIKEIIQEELQKLAPMLSENPERAGKRVNDVIAILQKRGFQKAAVEVSAMTRLAEGIIQASLAKVEKLDMLIAYASRKVLEKKTPEERNAAAESLGNGLKKLAREKRKETEKASTPEERPARKVVDADVAGARRTKIKHDRERGVMVVTVCKDDICAQGEALHKGNRSLAVDAATSRARRALASKLQGN